MDNPAERGPQGAMIAIGVAAAAGAAGAACAAWAAIGLFVATTLAIGLILLPLISGCAAGLLLRVGGKGLGRRVGLVAVIVTLLGCIVGDFIWLAGVPNQRPVSELLTDGIVDTLNVLFNLQKAVMYAVACYLAFAIAKPPKPFVSD